MQESPGQQLCLFAVQSEYFAAQLKFGGPFASQMTSLFPQVSHPFLSDPHHVTQVLKSMEQHPWPVGWPQVGVDTSVGTTRGEDKVGAFEDGGVEGAGIFVGPAGRMETRAQLKNCSGQTSDRVPSDGYGGLHNLTPVVQNDDGKLLFAK
jgi:hypothetical protein